MKIMTNYYILRYDQDGTFAFIGRNKTTLESVRIDVLDFIETTVSRSELDNMKTWTLEHLLKWLHLSLFMKLDEQFNTWRIQFSARYQKTLTEVYPEVEDEFFDKQYTGDSK